ncbi:MAG TPA: hypothetical protein VGQ55_15550 [Pyrinomonadaceae bacterium]|jgi:hypothetical protein|nr:hypothetical protein [Pyrinomonadaceae bacterium]
MNSELQAFIARCEQFDFRNREELLKGIQSGEIFLVSHQPDSDYPCRHFLGIYQRRAEHLNKFQTEHAERLRKDVLEFVENMQKAPDQRLKSWTFTKKPNMLFSVFESTDLTQIFGCIKALDTRLTPEHTWNDLWGKV